jgi:DNA-binding LacI/PurR family transcriptional regulator
LLILKNESFCGTFLETEGDLGQAGLIVYLHPEGGKPAALYRLYQAGAHFVCIDRHLGQYPVNYVGTNNHDAEYHAVAHLLALGHEGVAFLAGNFALSSEGERYAGYRDALLDNGLAPAPAHQGEGLDALVRQIRGREVTAVACANDRTASRLIERLAQEGLGVPAQVSVLGFDDSALFRYHRPALSTVRQEFEAIGYEAARALVKLLEGAAVGYKKILLPARLIQRESTGPRACIGGTHGDETGSIGGF